MNVVLIKILATALALSQVTTKPDAVKSHFDPDKDQAEVVSLLRAGCSHIRKAFDIEAINLDDLIATAMDDPEAMTSNVKVFRGINFNDLYTAYKEFCRDETIPNSPIDIGAVIKFYDETLTDLPDTSHLKNLKLPGTSIVFDGRGRRFAEIHRPGHRRVWLPLKDIPQIVQKAFIAAEDKRFYEHKGVDERGLVRAFVANAVHPDRPQGGSTITQQVAKNVLVGSEVTYQRKIREVIVASRLEQALTKDQILELYLNSIYLGRGAWGIEMAARSYFGKSARDLTLPQAALLAALAKGPSYFNPDRHPEHAQERYAYVLDRMKEDGYLTADAAQQALAAMPRRTAEERQRRDIGFDFTDQLAREAKKVAGISSLTADSYKIHSTIDPALERATEAALQEGLARYEIRTGRAQFKGPEANLADAVAKVEKAKTEPSKDQASSGNDDLASAAKDGAADATNDAPATAERPHSPNEPAWQQTLAAVQLPLYDVHWTPAVVLPFAQHGRGRGGLRVGLADGRVMPLSVWSQSIARALKPYDVIYVHLAEQGKRRTARAELRVRPQVQGAALVLENKTGRILAMAGAFSYPLSQLNRTTQTQRQPGSAFKPFSYLAALHKGLQPNTLIENTPITLPPVGSHGIMAAEQDNGDSERYNWSPKNFDRGDFGIVTLRRALEHSRNLATAHLLKAIDNTPEQSLADICALALEAKVYQQCVAHYPFILGAQPVRMIDLAAFYAAIANEGAYVPPYAIESIEQNGQTAYRHSAPAPVWLASGDRVAFYQLKSMLQGVVARGTAAAMARLSPYVAGKTGTSEDGNDAWFVGFTNDVTIAVWVGYDNGDGKRRTLGGSETGARVAVPIFEPIVEATWALGRPKTPLSPPSPEASRGLVRLPIDLESGTVVDAGGPGTFAEYFRREPGGQYDDTQYRVVSRYDLDSMRERQAEGDAQDSPDGPVYPWDNGRASGWVAGNDGRIYRVDPYGQGPLPPPPPRRRGFLDQLFGSRSEPQQPSYQQPSYRPPPPRSGPFDWIPNPFE